MGGSTKTEQQQQSTSSNTIDPAQLALLQGNYSGAQGRAATLTPYQGNLTAGFTPTQTQAQGVLSGVATNPQYANTNNAAIQSVQGVLGANTSPTITPQGVTASPYTAAQVSVADLKPYMNPFTDDVINASIAQNERARQTANMNDNQQATAAGAFGGSRSGVANALTNQLYDQNDQANIANLNSANFSQAQAAAGSDIGARNAASQFNAGQGLNAGEFNSTQGQNAQQSTFANNLAAQGLKINAAGQIVALNNSALGTAAQQGGILASVGDAQQAQAQTEINNAIAAWQQGQQLTIAQQQLVDQALGLIPNQQTVSSSGTGNSTTRTNPGLGGILSSIGSAGMGLGAMGVGI